MGPDIRKVLQEQGEYAKEYMPEAPVIHVLPQLANGHLTSTDNNDDAGRGAKLWNPND